MMRNRAISSAICWSAAALGATAGCSSAFEEGPGNAGQAGAVAQGQAGSAGSAVGGALTAGGAGNTVAGMTSAAGGGITGSGGGGAGVASGGNAAGGASSGTGGAGSSGGSSGGASGAGRSAGCGKMPTISADMYNNGKNIPITAANLQRRYILSVPPNYDNKTPYKLIIAWHQRDGNDNQMYANKYYHLQPLSNNTTIFVAPNGQKNGAPCTGAGNGESSCGWPNPQDSDMALADAVVKQVEENFCVDTNRIFATGWSFGGSMSYQTACERPLGAANGYIRGIAVYSGAQLSGQCTPSKAVAYYASHGTSDGVLNYSNGLTLAQNFAPANGCTWVTPTKVTSGNHICTDLAGCTAGYPERFCSFNGDHTPDPRDPNTQTSWEYQLVWDFFSKL